MRDGGSIIARANRFIYLMEDNDLECKGSQW